MKRVCLQALALCFLLLLPFVILSCDRETGKTELLGRWETEMVDEELGNFSMVYHFTENGEIFIEQKQGDTIPFSIPFGTYRVEGNRVTIESDGTEDTFTFSVKEDELTLIREGEESLVFYRI